MRKVFSLTALCTVFVLTGLLTGADEKKADPPKGKLPTGWKALGLTDAQTKDVYAIEADYGPKIEDLENQVKKLKDERYEKMVKVLTDEQKKRLKEIKDPIKESSSASSSGK
jgi:hypothetical protein